MSSRSEYLPRPGQWIALGMLVALTLVGLFQHHHDNEVLAAFAAAVAIGAGTAMLWPRGVPLPAYAVVSGAGVAVLCSGSASNVGWLAVCVLAGWCTLAAGWRIGVAYLAGAVALFAAEWMWAGDPDPGWAPWMVGTTFTVLAAAMVRHERDLVAQLRAAQAELADRARVEERNRIARELHDVIAHTLVVSQLHVSSARLAVESDPADAARSLAEAERLGRESLAEVRRAVGLLRDGAGGEHAPLPGAADVPALIERFRSAGTDVTLHVSGDPGIVAATTGLAAYRILQEALTNAVKHAAGWPVTVEVDIEPGRVCLAVESGGVPGHGSGMGLATMSERAVSVGGTCTAGPGGAGWIVRVELPA